VTETLVGAEISVEF